MSLQMKKIQNRESNSCPNRTILILELSKTNDELPSSEEMEKLLNGMRYGSLKATLEYSSILLPDGKWINLPDYEVMWYAHNPEPKTTKLKLKYSYRS
jgi:hypothetical protein